MTTMKRCSDCGNQFPATSEFFYRTKKARDGLYSRCKSCWNAYAKARNDGTIELVRFKPIYNAEGMKQCHICEKFKPATAEHFYRKASNVDGLQHECKDCNNSRKLNWIHENPEQAREHSRQTRKRHPEISRRSSAKFSQRNKERVLDKTRDWRKVNKEHVKRYNHDYRQTNRHQIKIDNNRRRTRKLNLPNDFTKADWQYCLDYFHHRCAVCKRPLNGLFHTAAADHWISLSKGGGSTATNIVPLCNGVDGCNQSKHNHEPEEWLVKRFGKPKAKRILMEIEAYFAHVRNRSSK